MPRMSTHKVPLDTGLFSPVGLQPAAIFRLAFSSAGQWLRRYAISHRRMISDYHTGFVVWAAQLVAIEPLTFLEVDCLDITMMGRVRGNGTYQVEAGPGGKPAVNVERGAIYLFIRDLFGASPARSSCRKLKRRSRK